ncbi:hypothetical protein [Desulfofalx alkaliphila]|uniref:hypothetical protein n=1 Tax=Desulfofalx alkaliphila TaxID=105483 RepID=UPI0004E274CC|nr:hypothetical protein [Desulfofalx alkaliphila]
MSISIFTGNIQNNLNVDIAELPAAVEEDYLENLNIYYQTLLNTSLVEAKLNCREFEKADLEEFYREELKNQQNAFRAIKQIVDEYKLNRDIIIQLIHDGVRFKISSYITK